MITWIVQSTGRTVTGDELVAWAHSGQLHPQTMVSANGGRDWIIARQAVFRMEARGDDGMAFLIPTRTSTYATLAQYVGLLSLLFFGGPLSAGAMSIAWDDNGKMTLLFRLGFFAVAALLGPTPVFLAAFFGKREIERDPTLRGKGRLIFGLVCGLLMLLPILGAIPGFFLGHHHSKP